MTHRRCCCCPGKTTGTVYEAGHRDLSTGNQWAHPQLRDEVIDGVDHLWTCRNGDITGFTQETVAVNCGTPTMTAAQSGSSFDSSAPGSIRFELADCVPTSKGFVAARIIWTGQTFNAADHVEHIARGHLNTAFTRRIASGDLGIEAPWTIGFLGDGPRYAYGHVLRAPDGKLFFAAASVGGFGAWGFAVSQNPSLRLSCWWGGNATTLTSLDAAGYLRAVTADELRAYGLTIDPLTIDTTFDVGFFAGIVTTSDDWTADIGDFDYTWKVNVDQITIQAIWQLDCVVAFHGVTALTASVPISYTGTNVTNICPIEMHGMSWSLALTTLPEFVAGTDPNTLQALHNAGYCYTDTQTASNGIDITLWYLPCNRMVLQFHDAGTVGCDTYIVILHDAGRWSDWSDGTDGSPLGESGPGEATAPAFAGASLINFCVPPHDHPCPHQITGLPDLSAVEWHGTDCLSAPQSGDYFLINSHRMQCLGPDAGWDGPECVQGLLPNQLPWMTNCYSLDPIAIGYRKRVTNLIGGSGWNGELCTGPAATNLCEAPVNVGNPPIGHTSTPYCWATRLSLLGFSDQVDDLYTAAGTIAYYFYVDITE